MTTLGDSLLLLHGRAGKSLVRPTYRCRRTELILSERGVCSCAELQVLLQRLKGIMSGETRDFNIQMQAVVNFFFFLQCKALKEIHAILTETLGEHAPLYVTQKLGGPV